MSRVFQKIIIFLFIPFAITAQRDYFLNASWKDALKLAKEKKQLLVVFVYSSKDCKLCNELLNGVLIRTEVMEKLTSKAILYKINVLSDDSNTKQFIEKYSVRKPSFFFIDEGMKFSHRVEPTDANFDLENIYNNISQWYRNKNHEIDIEKEYKKNPQNLENTKKYLDFIAHVCQKQCVDDILTNYFRGISSEKQTSSESFDLLVKYQPKVNIFFEEIYLRNLQKAVLDSNLYNQLLIKLALIFGTEMSNSKSTLSSKNIIEVNYKTLEKYNQFSPDFPFVNIRFYKSNYRIISGNINKFIHEVKENEEELNIDELSLKDSLLYVKIQKNVSKKSNLDSNKKSILLQYRKYFTESYAFSYYDVAYKIYKLSDNPKHIDFAINYANKALYYFKNASALAIYGLLCSKNEKYQMAYNSLIEAIELEASNNDKIDSRISKDTFETFLKLKSKIPEN